MKNTLLFISLMASLTLQVNAEDNIKMIQVLYQESSPGTGTYPYRILVNDDFLRFDGGNDEDGYILFDRKQKQVISVNHDDQSRFVIQPKSESNFKNKKITVRTIHSYLEKSPKIKGIKAKMHDIIANETLCRQALSFEGLLPEVTTAWKEYEELMQTQNQLSIDRTPKNLRTDCFLANNIINASLFLDYGLPFSVKSKDGNLLILQSFSDVEKPASFVGLPKSYREFSL